jgi:RNA 2',3'-cyclic 3'-phosphodiesterase
MRYFFALLLDAAAVARLSQIGEQLAEGYGRSSVPPENYHVTLCFVGNIEDSQVATLRRIGELHTMQPGLIVLDRLEFWKESRVIVAASHAASTKLQALSAYLAAECARFRPAIRNELWRPHVTLLRKVSQATVLQTMSQIEWLADSFCLMQSQRAGGRSVYTVVERWPLLDEL